MDKINFLNLEVSKKVIEEVENLAKNEGIPVVIAICNEWGSIIAVHFMDGALPASLDIAINKAFTSATIRIATEDLKALSIDDGELFGINNTNNNKIVAFPGGFPINQSGKIVGAIGVSGGSAEYDNKLALFGKNICEGVIQWKIMK